MNQGYDRQCTAFAGPRRIASGGLAEVALAAKAVLDAGAAEPVLIFDHADSRLVEVDFRGTAADVARRLEAGRAEAAAAGEDQGPRGPGRPRLGVIGREVTLLPRHWEWLNSQPGGASVTLRKLVEEARRTLAGKERRRRAQDSAYRFMTAMAGDLPGYEEACRALFAADSARFASEVVAWPQDVREHARMLAEDAFGPDAGC
jgi:hypothetical protein